MRVERENCCDDIAVGLTQDRVEYDALPPWPRRACPACAGRGGRDAAGAGPAGFERAGTGDRLPRLGRRRSSVALCIAVVLVIAAPLRLTGHQARRQPAPPATQPAGGAETGSLELTIADQPTGKPLAGVSLGSLIDGKSSEVVSDDAGHARIPLPSDHTYMNLLAPNRDTFPRW